jgi:HK97 family phage major capsid protein/HK97 family phage prohead protease
MAAVAQRQAHAASAAPDDIVHKAIIARAPGPDPLDYVMSDETVDRLGDVIRSDGWSLDNFRRNPVALFGHDSQFIIGRWDGVRIENKQLKGRLELLDPVSDRMREVHAAVNAGVLRAVSVGFKPIEHEPLDSKNNDPWGPVRFLRQELVECSLVSVPANPNALQIAKGLNLSRDTLSMIFGKSAKLDHAAESRVPGKSADPSNSNSQRTRSMSQLSERIEQTQTHLNELRDEHTAHLAKFEDSEMMDDDAIGVGEEINSRIATEMRKLEFLKNSEQQDAGRSVAVGNGNLPAVMARAKEPPPFALPKKKEEPGELLLHAIIAKTMIDRMHKTPEQALAERGWSDDRRVRACLEWVMRASTNPATTTTATWAQELVAVQYADLISALTIASVYGPLTAEGARYTLGRFGTISIPVEQTTPTIAGSFVAEGAPIPVRQGAFGTITIGLKKMAVITSFTRELLEHSTPNIDTQLRDMISRHTAVAIDTVLLDANPATAVRPPGLRNGVAGQTPTTGGGFNALVTDLTNLLNVLITANSLRNPIWIMNPLQAAKIGLTQSTAGTGVFPFRAEIETGRLLTYRVITSPTVPAGEVIFLDAADFASLSGDDARFELSDQATLHMEDTTPLPISTTGAPNTVAAPVRSMFQTDSIALRMVMPMNWMMRRVGLVSWVAGVTW